MADKKKKVKSDPRRFVDQPGDIKITPPPKVKRPN